MKTLILLLIGGALAWQDAPASFRSTTLIHENSVKLLPSPMEKGSYCSCVFLTEKEWTDFVKVACTEKERASHPKTDWAKEAVVVVVYKQNTNRISFKGFEVTDGEKKQATLTLNWVGIEPYYEDRYPAVFHRVATTDLRSIRVVVESKSAVDSKDRLQEIGVLSLPEAKAK